MKATGIVRRLDDLGRLVIPKEIRRIYRLKEGDSIEFFVSEHSEIILKKYSYLNDEKEMLTRMVNTLKEVTKCEILFLLEDEIQLMEMPDPYISAVNLNNLFLRFAL